MLAQTHATGNYVALTTGFAQRTNNISLRFRSTIIPPWTAKLADVLGFVVFFSFIRSYMDAPGGCRVGRS